MTSKQVRIDRLRQLQHERGLRGPVELGKLIGRKTNQTSDLLHGRAAFGEKVARRIEAYAGLPAGWLDQPLQTPQLAFSRRGIGAAGARSGKLAVGTDVHGNALALRPLDDDEDAGATAAVAPGLLGPLLIDARWAERLGPLSALENLRITHVQDDLMQPALSSGDVLVVDAGVRECTRDGIHVLRAHGRIQVRRVRMRMDGQLEVSADSPAVKSVDVASGGDFEVLGRVLWAWNGRRL